MDFFISIIIDYGQKIFFSFVSFFILLSLSLYIPRVFSWFVCIFFYVVKQPTKEVFFQGKKYRIKEKDAKITTKILDDLVSDNRDKKQSKQLKNMEYDIILPWGGEKRMNKDKMFGIIISENVVKLIAVLIRLILIISSILIPIKIFGIDIENLIVLLGVGTCAGIVISSTILKNLFSGILIYLINLVEEDDIIEINTMVGKIVGRDFFHVYLELDENINNLYKNSNKFPGSTVQNQVGYSSKQPVPNKIVKIVHIPNDVLLSGSFSMFCKEK